MNPGDQSLQTFIKTSIDSLQFEDIEHYRSSFCFDCMTINRKKQDLKMAHCSKSNQCYIDYQKYSPFYGKAIATHNYHAYFLSLLVSCGVQYLWLRQSIWSTYTVIDEHNHESGSFMFWLDSCFKMWDFSMSLTLLQMVMFYQLIHLF